MQNPWRRAGERLGLAGRFIVISFAAGLLAAGIALPAVGIAGIATRDAANTFNNLKVGTLGLAPSRSELLAADGKVIAYFYPRDIYRVPVRFDQIAPVMRHAIVAIEDHSFYQHGAFDLRGTLRAIANDLHGGGNTQGGSTLAQQYVKNVRVLEATSSAQQLAVIDDSGLKGLARKIQELRIAAEVEHELTKNQLLAAYLNVAYFSNHAYGIQVAAHVYFSTTAAKLNLTQAALLAGIVNSPTFDNPVGYPQNAIARRNQVLQAMATYHYISKATAKAAEKAPLGLDLASAPTRVGCFAAVIKSAAWFCNYVQEVLIHNYPSVWSQINSGAGGLKIYTSLNLKDQNAATAAVDYVEPPNNAEYNPANNADTQVMVQPGTGKVLAIAEDRTFGQGRGDTQVDYAVNSEYGGSEGVQTGSSSKIFTLITALDQGYPFGHTIRIVNPSTVGPYYNCHGGYVAPALFRNAEAARGGTYNLYNGTALSVNLYFAHLEQQVGLCNVVKTAVRMGMTRADGVSLLKYDKNLSPGYRISADNIPSFTLGAVNVSPMSMAEAYASVDALGIVCKPTAITKIVTSTGKQLPVQSGDCHRDMSRSVAEAADYILQGVLTYPGATADNRSIGKTAAGKTGTSNGGYYAAFAGFTPRLASYTSVFNPINPTTTGAMIGDPGSCYRELDTSGGPTCPGQMYGDNAPAATWVYAFLRANTGQDHGWPLPPPNSVFWSEGNGNSPPKTSTPTPPPTHKHGPVPTPPPKSPHP